MDEFDIIVVGGGSAGSSAAGRLSEGGRYTVCLIEAGGTNNNMLVKTPGFMPFIRAASNWKYETVPQKGLNGRTGYQPRGRGLGGSSAINAMVYIRGHQWDYDNWAALGCDGWSYDDVLPVFKRCEDNARGANPYHGAGGPLSVMDQHWPQAGSLAFIEAAAELQLPRNSDFNGASQDGFGLYQVTQKGGERWTAARAYVEPARSPKKSWSKMAALQASSSHKAGGGNAPSVRAARWCCRRVPLAARRYCNCRASALRRICKVSALMLFTTNRRLVPICRIISIMYPVSKPRRKRISLAIR